MYPYIFSLEGDDILTRRWWQGDGKVRQAAA